MYCSGCKYRNNIAFNFFSVNCYFKAFATMYSVYCYVVFTTSVHSLHLYFIPALWKIRLYFQSFKVSTYSNYELNYTSEQPAASTCYPRSRRFSPICLTFRPKIHICHSIWLYSRMNIIILRISRQYTVQCLKCSVSVIHKCIRNKLE